MGKAWVLLAVVWAGLGITKAKAQASEAQKPAAPVTRKCTVDSNPPSTAETALNKKQSGPAEKLFRAALAKDANDDAAHEGMVRALVEQDKVDEALKEATSWATKEPGNSMALVALGDAILRAGDPNTAIQLFQKAAQSDPCDARAFLGIAAVSELAGLRATGKRVIEQAYMLHPSDDEIHTAWISTRSRKERQAMWAEYAEHSDQISDEDRAELKTRLEKESLYHASDCKAAPSSPREAKVAMSPLLDGPSHFLGWGLDVKFNGQTRRLQIDTGASGITISRAAALFLGIKREDATKIGGIGDSGEVKTSVTHVASIKIGGMEFTNCPVEILEKWSALDSDGLIGTDVFYDSAVALDFPKHELRIAPLPERPGEKKPTPSLDTAGDDVAPERHNPYVAPEMAKWTRIYRAGHELLVPAAIVETKLAKDESAWKDKLFMLDTGSESNLISPTAAREVAKVSRDYDNGIRGVSGEVNKVFEAGKFTLAFAGLRLDAPSMTAIDLTSISHHAGVEVSGLIGAPALFQMVLHIDYRDNLVWCEYTKPK